MKQLIKAALVALLLYYLAQRGLLSWERTRSAHAEGSLILPALALFVVAQLIVMVRWRMLLSVQGLRLPFFTVFRLAMIGNFFNLALPGAVSGDIVKSWLVAREANEPKSKALATIVFNRVVGLTGLVTVALTGVVVTSGWERGSDFEAVRLTALFAGGMMVLGYVWLLLVPDARDPLLGLLGVVARRFPLTEPLRRLYISLRYFRDHRTLLAMTIGLSTVGFALISTGCAFLAWALGDSQLTLSAVFIIAPLGLLVSAIPISPAGVGTGHVAFTALFAALGSARGGDVFTLYLLYVLCQGAIGGLTYLRFKDGIAPDALPHSPH